jgi:GT2 family glycosyltransferase
VTSPAATVGVVVLTMGGRPKELEHCLTSLLAQDGVTDVLVVGNGVTPQGLDPQVRSLALAENFGVPGGRNRGAAHVTTDLILFFDDDAWIEQPGLIAGVIDLFAAQPRLGAVQLRIVGDDGTTMRRWVPRAHVGDPERSGPAFALAEGVTVVRRAAFEELGGWYDKFFFGHEGVDFTWRLWDAGWEAYYAAEFPVRHPSTLATRHAAFYRLNARNRVWLARRNLPWPLVVVYLFVWSGITSARLIRRPTALRTWWLGFVEGWRTSPGRRAPMRWATVLRLARLGQPPII